MYDDEYTWVATMAILDVPNFQNMPTIVLYTFNHIHENGVCRKNRYGALCN